VCGCSSEKEKRLKVKPHGYNKIIPIVEMIPITKIIIVLGFGFK
jgi:hypothetical protein